MKISNLIILYLLFGLRLLAQDTELVFTDVIKLSNKINSEAEEIMPIISPDGNKLYFVRAMYEENQGGIYGGQDIWISEKDENGLWKKATRSGSFNNYGNNAVVGISYEETTVFLLNSYEDSIGAKSGLSYSNFYKGNWTKPNLMKIKEIYNMEKSNDIYGLSVNYDTDVLLISMNGPKSKGKEDLYVCFKLTVWNKFLDPDSEPKESHHFLWSPPIHMGNIINSRHYEISPHLSPDGKTLFFASDRPGGLGSADIYYSKRLDDSWTKWSKPVNLGRGINSRFFDAYFTMNTSDSSAYLVSSRTGSFADIYYTKLTDDKIGILRKKKIAIAIEKPEGKKEIKEEIVKQIEKETLVVEKKWDLNEALKKSRNIMFDSDSYNLLLKDLDVLLNALEILNHEQDFSVKIIGHTDARGTLIYNDTLSINRSEIVKTFFMSKGIDETRIITNHLGEKMPIASNKNKRGREKNRRVELVFFKENPALTQK